MIKDSLFALLAAVLLSACNGHTARQQADGDTVALKYSSLLTIVDYDGYSVATIRNPWKEGKTLHTYVLVPRGEEKEEGRGKMEEQSADWSDVAANATIIRTPIQRSAVFTTVHCSLLTTLGCGSQIVGVADSKYIKVPWIQEQISKGNIVDCGNGLNPVVEKIMDIKPDVIMLSPFENSGGYGKVEDLGIPIVECAEYMETSPLGRAEWMRFYGRLYGQQQRADSLFAVVDSCYQVLKQQGTQSKVQGRSVLFDKIVGNVWYVPGGRSTLGRMIRDAGGHYPWADDDQSGSLSLPFETVLERAGESDVWLYRYSSPHDTSLPELMSDHRGYDQLKAYRTGEVYGCNVEQSRFYEETPFRPDWLLSDFIQILHPDITNLPPLRYYKKIGKE